MLNENIRQLRRWLQTGVPSIISMRFFLEEIAPMLTHRHHGEVIDDPLVKSALMKACAHLLGLPTPPALEHIVQLRVQYYQLQHGAFGITIGQGSYCFFEDLQAGCLMLITNQYGVWFAPIA